MDYCGRKKNRVHGSGSVFFNKIKGCYYWQAVVNGHVTRRALYDENNQRIKSKDKAIKAAEKLTPALMAEQQAEIALYVADAKAISKKRDLKLSLIWSTYLKQIRRPESGPGTLANYQKYLKYFLTWVKENHPKIEFAREIDEDIAEEYLMVRWITDGISSSTYNKTLQGLRLIFKHIMKPAGLQANPFDGIPRKRNDSISHRPFTEAQVKANFDGYKDGFFYDSEVERLGKGRVRERKTIRKQYTPPFPTEMKVLFLLCAWTGCRGQDAALMKWGNIDMVNRRIAFQPHKTARSSGATVDVPIHPDLYAGLQEIRMTQLARGQEDFVIPNIAAIWQRDSAHVRDMATKIIRYATGIQDTRSASRPQRKYKAALYSLHSFRHTLVSFLAEAGVPQAVIASIVGHASVTMTEHYTHISRNATDDAFSKLPVLSGGGDMTADQARSLIAQMSPEERAKLFAEYKAG